MNPKKLAYTLMTLSFVLLISGGVSSFVNALRSDRAEIFKRVNEVEDAFEVFSTNTTAFENVRDELYSKVFSQIYYDTMYHEDKDVKSKVSNYEQLVDELTRNTDRLELLCENVYYPDAVTNSRCRNYKNIYEQVINYFVYDIELYNDNIQKFNEYQENAGTLLRLRKYTTRKTYIDFNQDGVFDGKEE